MGADIFCPDRRIRWLRQLTLKREKAALVRLAFILARETGRIYLE